MFDTWGEYDQCAEWCASRGFKGKVGDPLPGGISAEALALINEDPEAFERRVNDCAYAQAMERVHERFPEISLDRQVDHTVP